MRRPWIVAPNRRSEWLRTAVFGIAIGIVVPLGITLVTGTPFTRPTPTEAPPASAAPEFASPIQGEGPATPSATPAPGRTPDSKRPTIRNSTPSPNAAGVPQSTTVRVTFSEQVHNVSASTVRLINVAGGWTVRATVRYVDATRALALDPARPMYPNTVYRVEIGSGISDLAGNLLVPVSWTFRTARG